jgi:DNA-directed RNA polymerase subunit RPC12/RpoP
MNAVEFTCPICRQTIVASIDAVGSLIACPQCQSLVHVPPPGDSECTDGDSEAIED